MNVFIIIDMATNKINKKWVFKMLKQAHQLLVTQLNLNLYHVLGVMVFDGDSRICEAEVAHKLMASLSYKMQSLSPPKQNQNENI